MSNIEKLQRSHRYPTLRVEAEPRRVALAVHARRRRHRHPSVFPHGTDGRHVALPQQHHPATRPSVIRASCATSCIASDAPAFNLGGDLELFARLIRENNREQLLAYARRCIDGVHQHPRRPGRRRAHHRAGPGRRARRRHGTRAVVPHHRRRRRRAAWACRKCCSACSRAWAPTRSCASACRRSWPRR